MPFTTRENAFGQEVSELLSGVDIFDLDLRVKIDLVTQPIKRNSDGFGIRASLSDFPLMIIQTTASLSSKISSNALWRESFALEIT